MTRQTILRLLFLLLLAAAAAALFFFLPVKEFIVSFLDWAKANGPLGGAIFALLYIPACLLFIPGSLLSLGAGFAFGVVWGTIAVSVGSTLGATAAFFAGRTLARDMIARRVAASPRFAAIDRAVAAGGFKSVLLTRLSPIFPFNLLNYAFGLTQVRARDYILASWIGMLPGTLMYVYLGSAMKNLADLAAGRIEGGAAQKILFFVGLAATVLVALYVTRLARAELDRTVAASDSKTKNENEHPPPHAG